MNHRASDVSRAAVAAVALIAPALAVAQIGHEPDAAIEQCLAQGKILKKMETLVGVTNPGRFVIECRGEQRSVLFKSVDETRRGVTRFDRGGPELDFSDSYRYERAAYLIDRELGLNMVPAAVIRKLKGDEGALIEWIENAVHEARMKQRPTGPAMAELARQKAVMRLFDALILNVDRRPENWLVDENTWKLYLIDHSRAFRTRDELPEDYVGKRARLSNELYDALKALDEGRLTELCGGLISKAQIKALLRRRDLIIEKIEQDVEQYGEEVVFSG